MTNIEHQTITLKRHNGPDWDFVWDEQFHGLVHKTGKNVYRLFFEDIATEFKPIWIGRLFDGGRTKHWYTMEKEIGAKSIDLCGCSIVFE
jgi:hypothetical protein